MKLTYTILLIAACALTAGTQTLFNPSMEGEPLDATMPDGWHACQSGTTPDILPGPWGVATEAYDGDSFVGLITRPNGTWEAIGQRFSSRLKDKTCYTFNIIAAHSDTYTGYNESGRMRVWLGRTKCDFAELVLDIPSLMHTEWENYPIKFLAKDGYEYIIIECYHPEGQTQSKGNILIDYVSSLQPCERT